MTDEHDTPDGPEGTNTADEDGRARILVIDDEERVGQAFALWLDDYQVETATSGEEGLEMMDEGIDVVLLDRHMPGLSGSEVLERIRETGYGCRVAMVTAVDPDFDIVEMPFDDYVSKPVDRAGLREVIERLLSVDQYDQQMAELYAVDRTIATLETDGPTADLEDDDRYHELLDRKADLEAELRDLIESFDAAEMEQLFDAAIDDGDASG
jgi:DNA-binding response OmpR family regulator